MSGGPKESPRVQRSPRGALAPLLVPRLPPRVPFGFLGRLLGSGRELGVRIELQPEPAVPSPRALEEIAARAEAELTSNVPPPEGRRAELEREAESAREVGRSLAAREQRLFRLGVCFFARGTSGSDAERERGRLERSLEAAGFRLRLPVYESEAALAPPSVGVPARRPEGYWHLLPSDSAAAFFPFVDEAVLEPRGVLLGLALEDASPVVLNRWAHASHSWGLFGATGSGKSFAAALLVSRERWMHPGLSTAVVDPLGEFGGWARSLGGEVLNPLDPASSGGSGTEKAARAAALLAALFPSLRDEESALLDRALQRLYDQGGTPTFSDLLAAVEREEARAPRLVGLLETFRSGSLRYLDGPTTVSLEGDPLVVDLSGVAPEQRAFHLGYALDALATRLAQRTGPKLLVVDEAHLLAAHPGTAQFLDGLVRRVRHNSAGLILLSQSPDDFLRTPAGRSTLRNLRATVLLRLSPVSPEARSFYALSTAEAEWLARARLPREAGYSEGLLRFGPAHLPIAVVAATPEYEWLSSVLVGPAPESELPGGAGRGAGLSRFPTGDEGDGDGSGRRGADPAAPA
ncbi:MAG: ATP-binding protein [Thermoplasmata archaeon]|nr:ATP-binding protein [Thermoplasmata archaeon]